MSQFEWRRVRLSRVESSRGEASRVEATRVEGTSGDGLSEMGLDWFDILEFCYDRWGVVLHSGDAVVGVKSGFKFRSRVEWSRGGLRGLRGQGVYLHLHDSGNWVCMLEFIYFSFCHILFIHTNRELRVWRLYTDDLLLSVWLNANDR